MKQSRRYILAWSSGHKPPKPVYYRKLPVAWDTTYDRDEATVFSTRQEALDRWRGIHRFPEDYEHCIQEGIVRAEKLEAASIDTLF